MKNGRSYRDDCYENNDEDGVVRVAGAGCEECSYITCPPAQGKTSCTAPSPHCAARDVCPEQRPGQRRAVRHPIRIAEPIAPRAIFAGNFRYPRRVHYLSLKVSPCASPDSVSPRRNCIRMMIIIMPPKQCRFSTRVDRRTTSCDHVSDCLSRLLA